MFCILCDMHIVLYLVDILCITLHIECRFVHIIHVLEHAYCVVYNGHIKLHIICIVFAYCALMASLIFLFLGRICAI
jgi:hypothetical protein